MLLENHNAIEEGGYQIPNSLRFQSASSQYLTRTPASAGNRQTWTWSAWVKLGTLGTARPLFYNSNGATSNGHGGIYIESTNSLWFGGTDNGSAYTNAINTNAVFRDPSAWYHIVVVCDTTNATQANRQLIYINGVLQSCTVTQAITQNANLQINKNTRTDIGYSGYTGATSYFDGYLAEINFIDGQALTPSSFGETNTLTGQWVAKKYTGTYGTNGFYLPFSNGTSTTTLGADSSGNGNNWTLTNFTRSAGVSDCWMVDVPSGNGYGPATQPSSNYAVMNPLINTAGYVSYSKANLQVSIGAQDKIAMGTIAFPSSGKYYYEYTVTTVGAATAIGVSDNAVSQSSGTGFTGLNGRMYQQNGNKTNGSTSAAYGASFTTNDVIGVAVDMDAGTIVFYKNNVSQGTAYSDLAGTTWFPAVYINSATGNFNFGQRSFAYTPPSGFKALCTANLPASTIVKGNQYMDAKLWSGTGVARSITGYNFSPDFVWIKGRSIATQHALFNVITGSTKILHTNSTSAEDTRTDQLTSFNSDGFSLGTDSADGWTNYVDGRTYVGWAWDAGSSTVTNTNGTISSQVRANPTSGVSVVTYTQTSVAGTIGHGLGIAPKMIIVKNRDTAGSNWAVYHASLGATNLIYLNATNASAASAVWNNTAPTSSVINVGNGPGGDVNGVAGRTQVAYCFAEIAGFSKFGSYTGNGSADGVFVYTGFRPKYLLMKNASAGGVGYDWAITDTSRAPYNAVGSTQLGANLSNAEPLSWNNLDILSNGFKLRDASAALNGNGNTIIYMAFAENPFAQANAR